MEKRVIRNLTTGAAQTSIRAQTKKEDVNEITIRRLLKHRKIKVYKKIKRNLLLDNHKRARKTACGRFRNKIRRTDIPWMIFVDECYFEAGEHFNVQNERCCGGTFEEIPERKRFRQYSKSSLTAMVFGAVWLGGRSKLIILPWISAQPKNLQGNVFVSIDRKTSRQHGQRKSNIVPRQRPLPHREVCEGIFDKRIAFFPSKRFYTS